MSASPSKPPAGPASGTPTGSVAAVMPRKKAPVSIFTQKKKPIRKPLPTQRPAVPGQAPNGAPAQQTPPQIANGVGGTPAAQNDSEWSDYSIYITKEDLKQGLHYHAMKLQARPGKDGSMVSVNPYDESQFTRPMRLHRRSARDKMETADQSDVASGVDDKERELMNVRRAERKAEREANQALIAPTGGDGKKPVKKKPQKKVEDVYYDENDPKQRQRAQLRYEEARPWHLEDFEGKNVWVGSYEEPLSYSSVMFEVSPQGFRLVPIEKWYKFTQTNKVNVMDSDAVEKHMGKKFKAPRWFLGTQEANDEARKQATMLSREQQRAQMRGFDDDEGNSFMKREEYQADVDEIDFEFNDEFQDDDEGMIWGEDEEAKEVEKKVREEMRGANLAGTGVKDEDKDWDAEEQREREKEQEEKRRTKRMRKQLIKKERKNEYDSESDRGEFSESSETEDSEEERERLEEEKKQEEARRVNGEKSGASTKGTNTPTGRAEKRDPAKSLAASLKRPGSPDLSEMSGNESSRKKAKGANGRAVAANAPNGARSLSPDAADPNPNPKAPRTHTAGSGSGSDTDTSRTGRPKIRLKASPPDSPPRSTSRAGSLSGGTGSRAQSPHRKAQAAFPKLEEIKAAIPPGGIAIGELVKQFKTRVVNRQVDFINLVKLAGKQDGVSKKILPKPPEDDGKA